MPLSPEPFSEGHKVVEQSPLLDFFVGLRAGNQFRMALQLPSQEIEHQLTVFDVFGNLFEKGVARRLGGLQVVLIIAVTGLFVNLAIGYRIAVDPWRIAVSDGALPVITYILPRPESGISAVTSFTAYPLQPDHLSGAPGAYSISRSPEFTRP